MHFKINKNDILSVKLLEVNYEEENNFYTAQSLVEINIDNSQIILSPELRLYKHQKNIITKSNIFSYLFFDLYVVYQGKNLSNNIPINNNENIHTIHIYYRPMIFWIWISAFFMIFGSLKNLIERK
ncbi:MAG: cytochrome c-type biogenesis CcmF C-terminal domain-containing protein [Rickettsiales bacterium]